MKLVNSEIILIGQNPEINQKRKEFKRELVKILKCLANAYSNSLLCFLCYLFFQNACSNLGKFLEKSQKQQKCIFHIFATTSLSDAMHA